MFPMMSTEKHLKTNVLKDLYENHRAQGSLLKTFFTMIIMKKVDDVRKMTERELLRDMIWQNTNGERVSRERNSRKQNGWQRITVWLLLVCLCVSIFTPGTKADAAAKSPYYIMVNRKQNCVTVYGLDKNGKYTVPVKAMTCSVGTTSETNNNETPTGTYKIYSKYRWRPLYYGVYGQYACRFNGPIMFHSVPYTSMSPSTLQYKEFNKLGQAASHGCVRLSCQDAKWIYDNCPNGTKVKVYDSSDPGPLGKPETLKISSESKYKNWDPTDSNKDNPWRKVPPKFSGLKSTMTVERCCKQSKLLSGVKALNFKGQKVKINISGKYDLTKEGSYKLTYKAKDYLGNTSTKKVTLVVKDTTAPTIYRNQTKLALDDESMQSLSSDKNTGITMKDLMEYIGSYVTAKDSGEELAKSYIRIDVQALYEAYQTKMYGTYEINVYAVDKAGNRSVTKVITVIYLSSQGGDNPDSGQQEEGDGSDSDSNERESLIGAII